MQILFYVSWKQFCALEVEVDHIVRNTNYIYWKIISYCVNDN